MVSGPGSSVNWERPLPACSGRAVALPQADTGDSMDGHVATDSSRCWRGYTFSKLQVEAEIMKNAIPQKNRLYTIPENVQEHLNLIYWRQGKGAPGRQETKDWEYILFAKSTGGSDSSPDY